MRSKVPISLWGSRGGGNLRSTLPNRPQPFAQSLYAVPIGNSAEGAIFGGFKCRVASFRAACVALRDVQTYFVTRRKSFFIAGEFLTTFSDDKFQFSWQAQYFRRNRRQLRGRRSALDSRRVVLRILCESHCQGIVVIFRGRRSLLDVSSCMF